MKRFIFLCLLLTVIGTLSASAQKEKYKYGFYLLTPKNSDTETSMRYYDFIYEIGDLVISIDDVKEVSLIQSETRPYQQIQFIFTTEGAKKWEAQTERYQNTKVGFVYKDHLLVTVGITVKISTGKCSFGLDDDDEQIEPVYQDLKTRIEGK